MHAPAPTSRLLEEVREDARGDRVGLAEIADRVQGRAHGIVLMVAGLPEAIPMIGLSLILAAPIFGLGCVMAVYGADPPIPKWIGDRSVDGEKLSKAIDRALPLVRWLDRVSRPRWGALAGAGRLQGVVAILMAVLLAVPVPGVNILAAFAVVGIGVGVLQRDGVVVGAAVVSAVLALAGAGLVALGGTAVWERLTG